MIGNSVCNITIPAVSATAAFIVPPILSVDFRETQILNKATIYSSTFVYLPVTPNRPVTITWSGRIWGRPPPGNFTRFDNTRTGSITLQPGQQVGLIQWSSEINTGFGLTARIIGAILIPLLTFGTGLVVGFFAGASATSLATAISHFSYIAGWTLGFFQTALITTFAAGTVAIFATSQGGQSSIIPSDLSDTDRGRLMSALIRSDLNTSIQITGITGTTLQAPNLTLPASNISL